jgi:DHA1 family inner membrane transport protein
MKSGKPLRREQVRLLLPLGASMALSLTGDLTMYAVLANQVDVVGISLAAVGVLLAANRLVRIPGNLLAGALNDRHRRRPLYLVGLCLGILSTLSYGMVRGLWPLLAGRMLWGLAWSLINVGGYTMILDRSTAEDRGRMTGLYQMAFMLGLTFSPIVGGTLTDAMGFRSAVRICALISTAGLLLAAVALPETRRPDARSRPGEARFIPRQWLRGLHGMARQADRRMLLAAMIYLVTFFVNGGVLMSTVGLYLGQRWGTSVSLAGVVIGVASLAGVMLALRALLGVVAGPVAGALSDRLPSRWPVVCGGLLLGVVGFLTLALPSGVWTVVLGVALVALSAAGLLTALAAIVGDMARSDRPGTTMGALATAGDIGSATGPLVAYALAAAFDLRWVYLLCAVLLALALVATLFKGGEQVPQRAA